MPEPQFMGYRASDRIQANAGAAWETLAALTGTAHALFATWPPRTSRVPVARARGHDGRHHRSEWGKLLAQLKESNKGAETSEFSRGV